MPSTQTVGYGDFVARTGVERLYSVVAQLIGASAFGFIIGNISSILETMDSQAASFKRKMDTLKDYLVWHLVSHAHGCVCIVVPAKCRVWSIVDGWLFHTVVMDVVLLLLHYALFVDVYYGFFRCIGIGRRMKLN